jgi:hypothetical protein
MALTDAQADVLGRIFANEVSRRAALNDFVFIGQFLVQARAAQKTQLQSFVQAKRATTQTALDDVPAQAAAATITLTDERDTLDAIDTEIGTL